MTQNAQDAYERLIRRTKETALLGSCSSILWWDEKTYMPRQGAGLRAEQCALLSGMIHERAAAPEIGELLLSIEESDLVADPLSPAAVNVREIRRRYDLRVKLPRSLVEELARATTLARKAWEKARAGSDYEVFRPHLDRVLDLKRQEAAALGTGETDYDALLDRYEPGETAENLGRVFEALRKELTAIGPGNWSRPSPGIRRAIGRL